GRRVDAGHPFDREPRDVMRPAGFRTGAAEPLAAERLAFDNRADLVAVDVEIADAGMLLDIVAHRVDSALEPEREPVPRRVDRLDDLVELVRRKTDDMEDRAEILPIQFA